MIIYDYYSYSNELYILTFCKIDSFLFLKCGVSFKMALISLSKWPDIEEFIKEHTGCKPYSGAGINPRVKQLTTILRSVDDTYYYDDDLSNIDLVKYTLFGHNGDQDEDEKRFNEPLLNKSKTKHIFLYRVRKIKTKNEYIWYGKYEIVNKERKAHIGKDYAPRSIVVLTLKKINSDSDDS